MIPELIILKDRIKSKRHDGRHKEIKDAFEEFEKALWRSRLNRALRWLFDKRHGLK